jgi:hypothetical protein
MQRLKPTIYESRRTVGDNALAELTLSNNIYSEFERALTAVLTDKNDRLELRDMLHRARASVDRNDVKYLIAIQRSVAARDAFLEQCWIDKYSADDPHAEAGVHPVVSTVKPGFSEFCGQVRIADAILPDF